MFIGDLPRGRAADAHRTHGQPFRPQHFAVSPLTTGNGHPFAVVGTDAELVGLRRWQPTNEDPKLGAAHDLDRKSHAQIFCQRRVERINLQAVAAHQQATHFRMHDLTDDVAQDGKRRQSKRSEVRGCSEIPAPGRKPSAFTFLGQTLALDLTERRRELRQQGPQFVGKNFAIRITILRVKCQGPFTDNVQRLRCINPMVTKLAAFTQLDAFDKLQDIVVRAHLAGRVQGQQFKEDDTERIDVGAFVRHAGMAASLFRRHVGR